MSDMPEKAPLGTPEPLGIRLIVSIGMGVTGLVVGTLGTHKLGASWLLAISAGLGASAVLAFVGWRFPEAFFKNRE
jgi:hypothetical protein